MASNVQILRLVRMRIIPSHVYVLRLVRMRIIPSHVYVLRLVRMRISTHAEQTFSWQMTKSLRDGHFSFV